MLADDAVLFIDTNKYLDLYRTAHGRILLAPLGEQADHIFVTQQVVEEVQRNKVVVAAKFLNDKFKQLKLQTFPVPDHLFGTIAGQGERILEKMSEICSKITQVNNEVNSLATVIIERICQSQDEVSTSLAPIFATAVPHSPAELQRANERKERGNPPGKSQDAIGDELTWEQVLTRFVGKRRLWIISRDGDYGTTYGRKSYLNAFLYEELRNMNSEVEAFVFEDISEGIRDFAEKTGVKADKLPTPEEAREIRMEEESLPPPDDGLLSWYVNLLAKRSNIDSLPEPYKQWLGLLPSQDQDRIETMLLRMKGAGIGQGKPKEEVLNEIIEYLKRLMKNG